MITSDEKKGLECIFSLESAGSDPLSKDVGLAPSGLSLLLSTKSEKVRHTLQKKAQEAANKTFGNKVYIRGLIEFTNYCKSNCYYCGIRRGNTALRRYRLTQEDILSCCHTGYALGFRTFVLQGGEDGFFDDYAICSLVLAIREAFPDCAITLSVGERTKESYLSYYRSGADRYLLRHETADEAHYQKLHPPGQSLTARKRCLYDLMDIGYQVGCGIMTGSPGQSVQTLYEDLLFMRELSPHMIGIGPFIPAKNTPFANEPAGSFEKTLRLLSIIRLLFPKVLLPATTALGTIHERGREEGILSGANVVMPNLSPVCVREKYSLYDNKICQGEEAAECIACLSGRVQSIGYEIAYDRGDYPGFRKK